jgi:hypothetical protein
MNYTFKVQSVQDGGTSLEKRTERVFESAYEAVLFYESFVDYGFATYGLTITLTEPNGDLYHKTFITNKAEFTDAYTRKQVVF